MCMTQYRRRFEWELQPFYNYSYKQIKPHLNNLSYRKLYGVRLESSGIAIQGIKIDIQQYSFLVRNNIEIVFHFLQETL